MCGGTAAARHNRRPARPVVVTHAPNMALQRLRRTRYRSGRSLRPLGSVLNARRSGRLWRSQA